MRKDKVITINDEIRGIIVSVQAKDVKAWIEPTEGLWIAYGIKENGIQQLYHEKFTNDADYYERIDYLQKEYGFLTE